MPRQPNGPIADILPADSEDAAVLIIDRRSSSLTHNVQLL
jgi:hypothetical protein